MHYTQGMSKSEKLAYSWLKKSGFKEIIYQKKRVPTFLADNKRYEVKRAYSLKTGGSKILFQPGEREALKKQNVIVLAFSENREPIGIIQPDELSHDDVVRGILFHDVGGTSKVRITILIDKEVLAMVNRLGTNRDHTIEGILRKALLPLDISIAR